MAIRCHAHLQLQGEEARRRHRPREPPRPSGRVPGTAGGGRSGRPVIAPGGTTTWKHGDTESHAQGENTNTVKVVEGENRSTRWIPEKRAARGVRAQQRTRSGRNTQHTTSRERALRAGAQFRSTDKGGSKAPWSSNGNKK
jgi:hypothetical protein